MTTQRDWGGLRVIIEESKAIAEAEANAPLLDCPICGTPLDVNTRGERNCPMGHFTTNAQTKGAA
jgi:hypothetical protein